MQELTTDCANQLRPSRTEYDSATNPNICQFVSIRGIRGLCGIGVSQSNLFIYQLVVIFKIWGNRVDPDDLIHQVMHTFNDLTFLDVLRMKAKM